MLVLLSPSKQMSFSDFSLSDICSVPKFTSQANRIMDAITEIPIEELSEVLKCNLNLAKNALHMAYEFSSEGVSQGCAALSYSGVAFKELNASKWDKEDCEYAQKILRIGSGVYGILRPFDVIKPYRLDLGSKLQIDRFNLSMQNFWKKLVTEAILEDLKNTGNILINCSSGETFDMLDLSMMGDVNIIQARFLMYTKLGLKSAPTVFVKKARGALANFIIKNRIKNINEFLDFSDVYMHYEPELSDENNLIFIYEKP